MSLTKRNQGLLLPADHQHLLQDPPRQGHRLVQPREEKDKL